jgi:single-strand DNA-binding protein
MRSVNKVTLIGYVGQDPELKYTANGNAVVSFSVATSSSYKSGDEWKETTQWHNVTAWQNTAEYVGEHVHKGTPVYVEGRIEYQKYEKDGDTKYFTKIVADTVNVLERTSSGEGNADDNNDLPF